jgi:long-chain acyl-CoA synthetase
MPRFVSDEDLLAAVAEQTVPRLFLGTVAARPDECALRWRGDDGASWHQLSWAEYADRVARIAGALAGLGVTQGDRVALLIRNRPEFHIADLAVLAAGATPVSIYATSAPTQIAFVVRHCGARFLIVEDAGFLDRARAADLSDQIGAIVVIDPSGLSAEETAAADVRHWDDLLATQPLDLPAAAAAVSPDDLATVIYTSGTTGPPKGVQITHENLCWVLEGDRRLAADSGQDRRGWRAISYLPMAHIAERMLSHYGAVAFGFEITTCPDLLQLGSYLGATHPQFFFGVPRVWEKMHATIMGLVAADNDQRVALLRAVDLGHEVREAARLGDEVKPDVQTAFEETEPTRLLVRQLVGLDAVEVALSGAAPLPADIQRFFDGLGIPLVEAYGLSETTGLLTWDLDGQARPGTVGRAFPGIELRLADDGEVLARGGGIFTGYLDDPVRTAEVLDDDGWFHTGDIGRLDDDGYLTIFDRKKELIITAGGKNVSPANLEAALKASPLIGQAAVIGDGRPYVAALVVLDPDAAASWANARGLADIARDLGRLAVHPDLVAEVQKAVDSANSHFSGVEQVRRFRVLADEWLPDSEVLTPTMKLKRRGVSACYADDIEALYRAERPVGS